MKHMMPEAILSPGFFITSDAASLIGVYNEQFPLDSVTFSGIGQVSGNRLHFLSKEESSQQPHTTGCGEDETAESFLECTENHFYGKLMEDPRGTKDNRI